MWLTAVERLYDVAFISCAQRCKSKFFAVDSTSPADRALQMRAAFVSVNLFSLLCTGNEPVSSSAMGDIMRYGGPITYLIFYSLFLFGVLVSSPTFSLG
jgi:hypothetical protein